MIAYVDSSMLARAYIADEHGHDEAVRILESDTALVTGTWTRIEVSGALVRAAKNMVGMKPSILLDALDRDLDADGGPVQEVRANQQEIERLVLRIVRQHGVRAMDAWHLACAVLVLPELAEFGEQLRFATCDTDQARVAHQLGLRAL